MNNYDEIFMAEAIRLSESAVLHGNEPFGAVLHVLRCHGMDQAWQTGIWCQ